MRTTAPASNPNSNSRPFFIPLLASRGFAWALNPETDQLLIAPALHVVRIEIVSPAELDKIIGLRDDHNRRLNKPACVAIMRRSMGRSRY